MAFRAESLAAGAAGVLCHHLIFIHGEWHMYTKSLMRVFVFSFLVIAVFKAECQSLSFASALTASGEICSIYLSSLFASIIVYRTMFHALRQFPGPPLAKVSKFWHVAHCLDSKNHLLMDKLHQQYGDFVRTGARLPKTTHLLYQSRIKLN